MTNHLLLFLHWAAYFTAHSLLASDAFKARVQRTFPGSRRYYRVAYNVLSVGWLGILLLDLARRPADYLFRTCFWSTALGGMLAVSGGVLLLAALWQYDLREFLGFQQLDKKVGAPEQPVLQTGGLNAYVRHPIYSGTLLFLTGAWLIFPTGYFLAAVASVFLYVPAGIYFEEKKLLRQFGAAYADYQKRVKRLIPGLW